MLKARNWPTLLQKNVVSTQCIVWSAKNSIYQFIKTEYICIDKTKNCSTVSTTRKEIDEVPKVLLNIVTTVNMIK